MKNIQNVLSYLGVVDYQEYEDEVIFDCIFCDDYKKNLQINVVKRVFHCWRCNRGGSVVRFICEATTLTPERAVKLFNLEEIDVEREAENIIRDLDEIDKNDLRLYNYKQYQCEYILSGWAERGIHPKVYDRYGLGYDLYLDRLVIPIIQRDKCLGLTRRSRAGDLPKYLHTKGLRKSEIIFGMDQCDLEDEYIVLTEGSIDALKLEQLGHNTVGILGSFPSRYQIDWIVKNFGDVILAFDNDKPGKDITRYVISEIRDKVQLYTMVYDAEDPGDLTSNKQIKSIVRVI